MKGLRSATFRNQQSSHFAACAVVWAATAALCTQPCAAQLRVVNYNISQAQGNHAALLDVFAQLHADDKPGFAVPVSLFIFQEVTTASVPILQNLINASAPPGVAYALGTYTNNNEDNNNAGAQAIFYRTGLLSELVGSHSDIYSGAGRYADRWRFQINGYVNINAWFYVYSAHLKSDTGIANQQERLLGATNIRANADALGANHHIIYSGDFNLYNNSEPAYLHFLSAGNGQAFDPLGTANWTTSVSALKHTQSPRASAGGGLIGGGLDDRFDFQLSSAALNDGIGLSIIPGTYRAFGNDGQHFDLAINAGNNFYYPFNLPLSNFTASRLHDASDHIPVIVEYQIPAIIAATISPQPYGRVIQNAEYFVQGNVSNSANVVTPIGADVLDFTATGSLGLSGQLSDSIEALSGAWVGWFPLDTSTVGPRTARITVTTPNQGVPASTVVLNSMGTIVRTSNPSFSPSRDLTTQQVSVKLAQNGGVQQVPVNIYNRGFDSLQALLDVDGISKLSHPFSYTGGSVNGIESSTTLSFTFDANGQPAGNHQAIITIYTSDEDIPGETSSQLTLTINVTLAAGKSCSGDLNEDGLVNVDDLVQLLGAWGACSGCVSDLNGDNLVNVDDLVTLLGAWGSCD